MRKNKVEVHLSYFTIRNSHVLDLLDDLQVFVTHILLNLTRREAGPLRKLKKVMQS